MIRLDTYSSKPFDRGRSPAVEAAWLLVQALLVSSFLPGSAHRRWCLRLFGARIGADVVIKQGVRVKFPWRLTVGARSWIGEDVWIDNLADVTIGSDCCISQGAYLCTGSHDWSRPSFDLVTRPIEIKDGSWIAAQAKVAPGVVVEQGAVLSLGGVATSRLLPWSIYAGVPATLVGPRRIKD